MIVRLSERDLKTKFGVFREILYYDGQKESIAIVRGDVENQENVLCRVHSHCVGAHIFNSVECECREEMERAQFLIEREGRGVVVWLDQEGKGSGHLALVKSAEFKKQGFGQAQAYQKAGFAADARNYRAAAAILSDLKIKSIVLLANNAGKAEDLRNDSIVIAGIKPVTIAKELSEIYHEKLRGGYKAT